MVGSNSTEALMNLALPRTVKDLNRSLCRFRYWQAFLPGLAMILNPLEILMADVQAGKRHASTKKVDWTPELESIWCEVRDMVAKSSPSLCHPPDDAVLHLQTDGSLYAVSASLYHMVDDGNGKEVPMLIASWSRRLTGSQKNWCPFDIEAHAVHGALMAFEDLVVNHKIIVHTDHRALVYVLKQAPDGTSAPRHVHMRADLQGFDLEFVHRPGHLNVDADDLSRAEFMQRAAHELLTPCRTCKLPEDVARDSIRRMEERWKELLERYQNNANRGGKRDSKKIAAAATKVVRRLGLASQQLRNSYPDFSKDSWLPAEELEHPPHRGGLCSECFPTEPAYYGDWYEVEDEDGLDALAPAWMGQDHESAEGLRIHHHDAYERQVRALEHYPVLRLAVGAAPRQGEEPAREEAKQDDQKAQEPEEAQAAITQPAFWKKALQPHTFNAFMDLDPVLGPIRKRLLEQQPGAHPHPGDADFGLDSAQRLIRREIAPDPTGGLNPVAAGAMVYPVVVPEALRPLMVKYLHDSCFHMEADRLFRLSRAHIWFKGMREYMRKYVGGCELCASRRYHSYLPRMGLLKHIPTPPRFHSLYLDLVTQLTPDDDKHVNLLVAMDLCTRYLWVQPMKTKGSVETADALLKVLNSYGVPVEIVSDLGTEFNCHLVESMLKNMGTASRFVPAMVHQSNPVENAIRFLQRRFRSLDSLQWKRWPVFAAAFAFAWNTALRKGRYPAPFTLMHGQPAVLPYQRNLGLAPVPTTFHDLFDNMSGKIPEYRELSDQDRIKRNALMNRNRVEVDYKVGQQVMVYRPGGKQKKSKGYRWVSGTIVAKQPHDTYDVEYHDRKDKDKAVNISPQRLQPAGAAMSAEDAKLYKQLFEKHLEAEGGAQAKEVDIQPRSEVEPKKTRVFDPHEEEKQEDEDLDDDEDIFLGDLDEDSHPPHPYNASAPASSASASTSSAASTSASSATASASSAPASASSATAPASSATASASSATAPASSATAPALSATSSAASTSATRPSPPPSRSWSRGQQRQQQPIARDEAAIGERSSESAVGVPAPPAGGRGDHPRSAVGSPVVPPVHPQLERPQLMESAGMAQPVQESSVDHNVVGHDVAMELRDGDSNPGRQAQATPRAAEQRQGPARDRQRPPRRAQKPQRYREDP